MTHIAKPFYTGIKAFDHAYGSKAHGGDAWLFFGQSGGGKTVLACQTAGYSAIHGKLVAYISTHTKIRNILMRAYSAVSSVPYKHLKQICDSGMDHPLAPAFRKWIITHEKNLEIIDWRNVTGLNFEDKYRSILDSFQARHGKMPDLTVLDQLSDVLQSPFDDHIQKRDACNDVANIVASTAAKLKNVAILIAKTSTTSAGKASLTQNDTAESRSLGSNMCGVLGITSLERLCMTNADTFRNQYLVVSKCRGEIRRIQVFREFDRARFIS